MYTLEPIQEPIKYKANPDVKIYLRRKHQNSGLFVWEGNLNAVGKEFNDAIVVGDYVYAVNRLGGTIEKFIKATGVYDSTLLSGLTNPRAIIYERNMFWLLVGDTVQIRDINFNLIHTFGSTGTGNSNFSTPWSFVKDTDDRLLIVDKGNNRIKTHAIGESRANITESTFNGCTVDELGNTYFADTSANTIRKYDSTQTEITTGGFPISFGSDNPTDVSYYLNDGVGELYVAVNPAIPASGTPTIQVYNSATGATIDASRVSIITVGIGWNTLHGVAVNKDYIFITKQRSTGEISVYRYDRETGTNKKLIFENTKNSGTAIYGINLSDNYIFFIWYEGGDSHLWRTDYDGVNIDEIDISGINVYSAIIPVSARDDVVYTFNQTANTIVKYRRVGLHNWVVREFFSVGTITNARLAFDKNRDDLIMSSQGNNVQFYNWGLWVANFGTVGAGDGQFNSPYGIARIDHTVFISEYGGNDRVQQFTEATGALVYSKKVAVSGGASDVAVNSAGLVFVGVNGAKQILVYDNDVETYYTQFYIKANAQHLAISNDWLFVGDTNPFYAYSAEGDFGLTYGDTRLDITNKIDFTQSIKISITSDEKNFSIGRLKIGNVGLKVFNDGFGFDAEYFPTSIFYSNDFSIARNESLVEIEVDGEPVFHGFIDGKNVKPSRDSISMTAYSLFKKLKTIQVADLELPSTTYTVSQHLANLLDNIYVRDYIIYDATLIELFDDFIINDITELGDTILDQIEALSQLGFFSFGLISANKFFTYSFRKRIQERRADYLITNGAMLEFSEFNRGEQRLFSGVRYKDSAGVGSDKVYNFSDRIKFIYPEKREIEIDNKAITVGSVRQDIVDQYSAITQFPTKEFKVKTPLFTIAGDSYFRKQFAFNIGFAEAIRSQLQFSDPRDTGVNVKTLELGNGILPEQETTIEKIVNSERLIYYVLGIELDLSGNVQTTLKLKETIDNDQIIFDYDSNIWGIVDFEKSEATGEFLRNVVYDYGAPFMYPFESLEKVNIPVIDTVNPANYSRSLKCFDQGGTFPRGLVKMNYGDMGRWGVFSAWTFEFYMYANDGGGSAYAYGIFGKDTDRGAPYGGRFAMKIVRENTPPWEYNTYFQFGSNWVKLGSWGDIRDVWSHWAIVWNGTTYEVFKNGISQGTYTNSNNIFDFVDSASDLYFGSDKAGAPNYLDGRIDSIVISNIARSAFPTPVWKLKYLTEGG